VADRVRLDERAADADKLPITVFAAASLTNALQELGTALRRKRRFPSDSRSRRAPRSPPDRKWRARRRLSSADVEWMDYLQARNLIQRDTRHDVLGNRLVLIAPADSKIDVKIAPVFPWPRRWARAAWLPAIPIRCPSAATPGSL